jgi:hypothetical protein
VDVITLNVEEQLKGDRRYTQIRLNNHTFSNNESCTMFLGPGNRFRAGARVLAFLQRDTWNVGADWVPTGIQALHIATITNDQVMLGQLSLGSLAEVKRQIAALVGSAPPSRSSLC